MPNSADPIPYLLFIAGITGILLIVVASTDALSPRDSPTAAHTRHLTVTFSKADPHLCATPTPSTASQPAFYTATPSRAFSTPAPTTAPAPTPTPTRIPITISPPFISPTGSLAYVESGMLSVVKPDDSRVTVATNGVAQDAQAVVWSPDGRWLLYTVGASGTGTSLTTERQTIHLWDSRLGDTLHLARGVPGFPTGISDMQDATWSPKGTRILFRGSSDASSRGAWVLDVTATRVWRLTKSSVSTAIWIDEDTVLCKNVEADTARLLSVGPPAQMLTKTIAMSGAYALSPERDHVASFKGQPDEGQELQLLPLPGHAKALPLSLSHQPMVRVSGHAPLWSPDGRWVTYGAESITASGGQRPYTLVADTLGISKTQSFPSLLPVAWSPDGRLLAGIGCSDTTCSLQLLNVFSGQATRIMSAEDLRLWDLAWSPRGVYLVYSVSGSDMGGEGLMLWNRATGEQHRLIQASATQPLTDLQWTPDGCTLYAAQREKIGSAGLAVSTIWGIGPTWKDRWRVAPALLEPGSASTPSACPAPEEALKQRKKIQEAQTCETRPLCPSPLMDGHRLIAYYGTPLGPGLGILGQHGITETLRLLKEQTQIYQNLDQTVDMIPTFHMVTTIADGFAGPDEDYNHRVPHETIQRWIDGMKAESGWSILDIQVGRASLVDELGAIEPLLLEPGVHLAVDPEFIVGKDQVPGEDLGQITGHQINWIQAKMDRVARAVGQRKMVVIHQFNDRMIKNKGAILDYPLVDLVWDADGFGSPDSKIKDYNQYKREPGFEYGGFKVFYEFDEPLMTPEEILSLDPSPQLVIYQ